MVVSRPIPEPPVELVAVRAPSSSAKVSEWCVLVEHLSVTGRNDRIERPVVGAVPPFLALHDREVWRGPRELLEVVLTCRTSCASLPMTAHPAARVDLRSARG